MLFAACDIGGTFTQAALIDGNGSVVMDMKRPTAVKSGATVIAGAVSLLDELMAAAGAKASGLEGIGVGVAGLVDFATGTVVIAPNLPFRNTPLAKLMARETGAKVLVDNDATLALLGEARFGAGRKASDIVMVTIGTGIGGGIMMDGKPYRGATGSAAEIGHMVIDMNGPKCRCGRHGCLEAMASGRAIAGRAKEAVKSAGGGKIVALAGGNPGKITGEAVAAAAAEGDRTAIAVLKETGRIIGIGLANIANIFNPEMIIMGGGVMDADTIILDTARRHVVAHALKPNGEIAAIVPAELGNKAGLAGAVSLFS